MTPNQQGALAEGRPPLMVLMLRLRGGSVYAIGTESAQVEGDDGPIRVAPGLVVDNIERSVDPFALAGETALTQARVTITLTDSLVSLAGDYRAVGAASAELAMLWPGDTWAMRSPLLMGTRLSGVTLGAAGQPTTFTLEAAQAPTSAVIGDAARTVGDDFPAPIDNAGIELSTLEGVQYPTVHGKPYSSAGVKIGEIGGDGYDRVVIAGHVWTGVGNVEAFNDAVSLGTFAVQAATATSGAYAYIRSATAEQLDNDAGAITIRPIYGGAAGIGGTSPALSLGDLLELWLTTSDLAVDWARCRPAIEALRSWPAGVYLDAETSAIDAVRDHIVSIAPLVEMQSAAGVWFYWADLETATPRGTLTEGQELVSAVGGVSLSEIEEVRNSVVVRYAYDEFAGEYTGSLTVDATNDAAAYLSQQLYGTLSAAPIETVAIADATTARRVGRSLIQRRAFQRRSVSWLVSDYAEVEVGEVYTLAISSQSIAENAVATIVSGTVARVVTFTVLERAV